MPVAYLAVGSNIDPIHNVPKAVGLLSVVLRIEAASAFYRTPAVGPDGEPLDQPDYANGALKFQAASDPHSLRRQVLRPLERGLGRRRGPDRFAPRPIDLDLLVWGGTVIDDEDLTVPDPEIPERAHLAVPLLELAPHLELPGSGVRLRDAVAALDTSALTAWPELSAEVRRRIGQR